MKRFHRLQNFAAAFLVAQLVIGYAGWLTPKHEIFPFASWFLFLLVPDRLTDYDLILRGSEARPMEPQPFNEAPVMVATPHSVAYYQLIQQLGGAVERRDFVAAENTRRQIEENFYFREIRYDLVKVDFRPVDRLKTGKVLSRKVIRSYVADHPESPATASQAANS